jgi:hypothetical protein
LMEMAVRSMEMALGALPRPGMVPEQRLLSPEIRRRRRWSYGTLLEISPIVLGFSVLKLFIGERASSEVDQGGLTTRGRGQEGARHPMVRQPSALPPTLFRSSSCVREK